MEKEVSYPILFHGTKPDKDRAKKNKYRLKSLLPQLKKQSIIKLLEKNISKSHPAMYKMDNTS